ncbi:MAG: MFS transporter [Comamonas sp. SCN 65-56]|uniref:YbfB/YjiJ family MFS transporter n=1 Tax=Comamonas sp. SCN 65-56 TaxID=1660095 RepID=UPI00086AD82B|nr:YbfB/YjiJ family MFS transporter [Comamonas sp. SCN 65-56]ODS93045.1 MAG: MFS transporter [Comamonas sp. SCN 65-56]
MPVPVAAPAVSPWSERPWAVALAGLLALAVAMGVGRFAFTPLLPMMLHDKVVTIAQGSWLATANYIGYLVGALVCTAVPWLLPQLYRRWGPAPFAHAGLAATVVLTLAMALPIPALWPTLRFLAGVASAFVLLNVAAWCMVRLALQGRAAMGGLIFAGPGLGIVLSGLAASAMVAVQWRATAGWVVFGVLALLWYLPIWPVMRGLANATGAAQPVSATAAPASAAAPVLARALHGLGYGLAGLGYIVTATFLPVIARMALEPGSPWPDLFWPIFGVGATFGVVLSTRSPEHWDRRWLLVACYAVQASGIIVGLLLPTVAGFAMGSLLLGLPFLALVSYAMQVARRLWPEAADSFMSLITVVYGVGQIIGPPITAWLLAVHGQQRGFTLGLTFAASALVLGALIYAGSALRWRRMP